MCAECVVESGGDRFCSKACVAARHTYRQREHAIGQRKVGGTGLAEWAWRCAILLLGGGILYYVLVAQHVRSVGDFGDMIRRIF